MASGKSAAHYSDLMRQINEFKRQLHLIGE